MKGQGQEVYADSAYRSEEMEKMIEKKQMKSQVHQRAYRNKPLSGEEKTSSKEKSRVPSQVEHIFGFMKTSMKTDKLRAIGKVRMKGLLDF